MFRYLDWSQVAEPQNPDSNKVFGSAIVDPNAGFGGNGDYIAPNNQTNPYNVTSSTGGGCDQDVLFVLTNFMLNFFARDCLRRDFNPSTMNTWADLKSVKDVLAQKDCMKCQG
ncbi:Tyrosinase [Ascochyta rabiei]|uniref:Metal ion binding n=1 Tax=Didymella rabiei TaxID=5454 RepID=A0A163JVX2_DIDRA|nr:Tyrosinase [Ascochyta rabiei]KZM26632.1 metal ion binding [Ascochyta rabiei]UPX14993.1 Tyrosinase [Ascochyta rabiei]